MVIQRWQSVLLLIASILMLLFSFMNLCNIELAENIYLFSPLGIEDSINSDTYISTIYLFAISLLSAIISSVAIFMFSNLKLQKILCRVNSLLILAVYATTILIACNSFEEADFQWTISFSFPAIALILTFIANRLIIRDENKLRSYDRIR